MHLLFGFIAFASFGLVAVIAEGKPRNHNTLKNHKNKRGLSRR